MQSTRKPHSSSKGSYTVQGSPRPYTLSLVRNSHLGTVLGFWVPRGSKDPNNRVSGPKYYNMNGIWALKPYYLGPWTLRGTCVQSGTPRAPVGQPRWRSGPKGLNCFGQSPQTQTLNPKAQTLNWFRVYGNAGRMKVADRCFSALRVKRTFGFPPQEFYDAETMPGASR